MILNGKYAGSVYVANNSSYSVTLAWIIWENSIVKNSDEFNIIY